jgi:hypothetical protein
VIHVDRAFGVQFVSQQSARVREMLNVVLALLEQDDTGSWVEVLEEYLNIGVILDMCVIDVDRQGQCQAVTCSGAFKDGTLRVVRSGIGVYLCAVNICTHTLLQRNYVFSDARSVVCTVRYKNNCKLICAKHRTRFPAPSPIVISGIHEQASIELPCIKGMWALRESDHTPYDKYLIQVYAHEKIHISFSPAV